MWSMSFVHGKIYCGNLSILDDNTKMFGFKSVECVVIFEDTY